MNRRISKIPSLITQISLLFNTLPEMNSIGLILLYKKENELIKGNELLSEPIWLNKRYQNNGRPIFLSNWMKSGIIYVKDLFDREGKFISANFIFGNLIDKRNWIAQYSMIKEIFKKIPEDYHLLWLIQSIMEMHDKHFFSLHDSLNIAC